MAQRVMTLINVSPSGVPPSTPLADSNQIIAVAREWIGTPYHHQASLKGVGCDCIGLVRGIWRELYGFEAEPVPAYSRDWGDTTGDEDLLAAGDRNLQRILVDELAPGDVFAIRWKTARSAKHVAIFANDNRFIHAYEKRGVVEVTLTPQWRAMIVGAWRFSSLIAEEK